MAEEETEEWEYPRGEKKVPLPSALLLLLV
jgi:hypothetical protein